ncbi:MAG TPA: flavin reductase family protein [Spirochaetota bacterium]|jgi:flavin reductase (DIM6/NTAB) family NADH-FMN oxidoreductase RutF|nr:flavin reductase family protein [Spirochaetota bacterium]OPZ37920.1 MAG: Flavoredoxin [Spirochaetes bacterium ADurb.BinA120]HNU91569.1 flavin reductase family protein [Spirochaetota bacterium]HPI15239.1 flavin reductase family protein [Spirochaetota bacterium]HPO44741.1 flavin reductase family protein [Spirochaetota bacterium]
MSKVVWKPGTMLYPVPAVLVTSHNGGTDNVLTVSWAGTVCTEPAMLSISLRPERHSYGLIRGSGEFAVNLPTADMARAVDLCGVRSGADCDKFKAAKLTRRTAGHVSAPLIAECPVCIECRVRDIIPLGSHHLFISEVLAVHAEESLMDSKGKFHLERAGLLCYNHGHYCAVTKPLGDFGFSVRKKRPRKKS